MSLSVCPIATVQASAEAVWSLLSEPDSYASWGDADTAMITPQGSAQSGQEISAHSRALGLSWSVHIRVESVDANLKELSLTTSLPLGITILNHIKVIPFDANTCRVSFG
jgi:hypothetical protein